MKLKIATWNINCGMNAKDEIIPLNLIYDLIWVYDFDVLLLQEIVTSTKFQVITPQQISRNTQLKYFTEYELSSSHQLKDSFMGLSILSKHPLELDEFFELNNPNFRLEVDGRTMMSHKKGFLFAQIKKFDLYLGTGHCPSFHYFKKNDVEYKDIIYRPLEKKFIDLLREHERIIVGGDFNTSNIMTVMPDISRLYTQVIHGITYPKESHQTDYIFLNNGLSALNSQIVEGEMDHYLCVAEVALKEERNDLAD